MLTAPAGGLFKEARPPDLNFGFFSPPFPPQPTLKSIYAKRVCRSNKPTFLS